MYYTCISVKSKLSNDRSFVFPFSPFVSNERLKHICRSVRNERSNSSRGAARLSPSVVSTETRLNNKREKKKDTIRIFQAQLRDRFAFSRNTWLKECVVRVNVGGTRRNEIIGSFKAGRSAAARFTIDSMRFSRETPPTRNGSSQQFKTQRLSGKKAKFQTVTNKSREFYLDLLGNSCSWDTETELSELSKIHTYTLILLIDNSRYSTIFHWILFLCFSLLTLKSCPTCYVRMRCIIFK